MKKFGFLFVTFFLLCLQMQAAVGDTFSASVPYGDGVASVPFKVVSMSPRAVEVSSSGSYMQATAIEIPQTVSHDGEDYTVTGIGYRAFVSSRITGISLPETVTSIGEQAFIASDLTEIVFPESVTSIGGSALSMCFELASVHLPSGLSVISNNMFYSCRSLKTITLPQALTIVEYSAFRQCTSLESIYFTSKTPPQGLEMNILAEVPETCLFYLPPGSIEAYKEGVSSDYTSRFVSMDNNQVFTNEVDGLEMSFTIIDVDNLIAEVGASSSSTPAIDPNFTGKVTIPATATFLGHTFTVQKLGFWAFRNCHLSEVDLGTVEEIGVNAFENTPLQEVTIPSTVTSISSHAFQNCTQLRSLTFQSFTPPFVSSDILEGVPSDCVINIPAGSRDAYLQQQFFQEHASQIQEFKVSTVVKVTTTSGDTMELTFESIDSNASEAALIWVRNVNATGKLTIPDTVQMNGAPFSVTRLKSGVLSGVLLDTIVLPQTLKTVDYEAFSNSAIKTMTLPDGVTEMGSRALAGCEQLRSLVLPASLSVLKEGLLSGNKSLESVVLPAALTQVEYDVFSGCESLQTITFTSSVPPRNMEYNVCYLVPETCLFIVPRGSKDRFVSAAYSYKDRFVSFDNGQTFTNEIDGLPMTFIISDVDALVAEVGANVPDKQAVDPAYRGKVAIPSTVTFMDHTFTVKSVGFWAFTNCQISEVDLGSVTIVGYNAFENTQLQEVTIPATVTNLYSEVFKDCQQLRSLTFLATTPTQVHFDVLNGVSSECTIFIPTSTREAYLQQQFFKDHEAQIVSLEDGQLFTNNVGGVDMTFMITDLSHSQAQVGDGFNAAISTTYNNKVELPSKANFLSRSLDVVAVGDYAFSGTSVTQVTIPGSIAQISFGAFSDCDYLWFSRFEGAVPPVVSSDAYDGSSGDSWFVIPAGTREAYLQNSFFKDRASRVVSFENGQVFTNRVGNVDMTFKIVDMENHICQIGDGVNPAISTNYTGKVTLPTYAVLLTDTFKVERIGDYAFKGCHFPSIDVTDIVVIGVEAFAGGALTAVTFAGPNGGRLASMGNGAFMNNHITGVDLRNTQLTRIPDRAFAHNDISDLKLGDKLVDVGNEGFLDNSLSTLDTESVSSLGDSSFFDNPLEELYFGKGLQQGLEVVHVGSLTFGGAGVSIGMLSVGAAPLAVVEAAIDATIIAGSCIVIAELIEVWEYLEELRKTRDDYKDYNFAFWVDEHVVKSGSTDPYHVIAPAGSHVTYIPKDCWMNYENQTVQMPEVTEETQVSVTATCHFAGFFGGKKTITETITVQPKDPEMKFKDRDIKMALRDNPVTLDMKYDQISTQAAQGVTFGLSAYSATAPASYFDDYLQVHKITGSDNYPRPRLVANQALVRSFTFAAQSELKMLATERVVRADLTLQGKQLNDTTRVTLGDSVSVDFCTMQVGDVVALPTLYELFPTSYKLATDPSAAEGAQRYARAPHYGVPTITVVNENGNTVDGDESAVKLTRMTTSDSGETQLDSVLIYAVKEGTAYLRLADPKLSNVFVSLKINIVKPASAARTSTPCEWDFTAPLSDADKKAFFETAKLRIINAEEYWRHQDGKDYYSSDMGFYGRDFAADGKPQKWSPVFTNGGKNLPAFNGIEASVDTDGGNAWRSPIDRIRLYSNREKGEAQVAFNGKTSLHILKPDTLKDADKKDINVYVKASALAGSNAASVALKYDYKEGNVTRTYSKVYTRDDIAGANNSTVSFSLEPTISDKFLTLELNDVELSSIAIRPAASPDTIIDSGVIYVAVNSQKRFRVAGFDKADADSRKMADAKGRYALTLKDSLHYEDGDIKFDAVVDTVSQQAFSGNNAKLITKVTVQKGVRLFGKEAFAQCDSLLDLYLLNTEADKNVWGSKVVADITRLHVALPSLGAYSKKFTDYSERFYSDYTIVEGGVSTLSLDCNAQLAGDATLWVVNADTLAAIGWTGQYGVSAVYVPDSIINAQQGVIVRASTANRDILLRHTAKTSELNYANNKLVANLTQQKAVISQNKRFNVKEGVLKSFGAGEELAANTAYLELNAAQTPATLDILWEWYGTGTETSPYLIYIALQMDALSKRVNDMSINFTDKHFRLMRDIDFGGKDAAGDKGYNFTPVGINKYGIDLAALTIDVYDPYGVIVDITSTFTFPEIFQGTFDGYGHTVSGLYIKKQGTDVVNDCQQGLFGWVGASGVVKNLTLADSYIAAHKFVGGLVGLNNGHVVNCHVKDGVKLEMFTENAYSHGGIVGYNGGGAYVSGCISSAELSLGEFIHSYLGGITGHCRGTVENSLFLGAFRKNSIGAIAASDREGKYANNFYTDDNFEYGYGGSHAETSAEKPEDIGNEVQTYGKGGFKGITAYENGLLYDGLYYFIPTINLIMNGDNTEVLAKYDGKVVNVNYNRISAATQNEDGQWQSKAFSICLPYDVTIPQEMIENRSVNVYYLDYISKDCKEFVFTNSYEHLTAGRPYVVVVNRDSLTYNAKNVRIKNEPDLLPIDIEDGGQIGWWTGCFRNIYNEELAAMKAYIIQSDGYYRIVSTKYPNVWIGCFRSFFYPIDKLSENGLKMNFYYHEEGGFFSDPVGDFPAVNFESDGDMSDDMDGISIIHTIDADGTDRYFDLKGRPLDGKPSKGAYIYNGNKYVNKKK